MTPREILLRLLELTPEPPADAEVEHAIAAFEAILDAREEMLAQIAPPLSLADADRPLLVELERRQVAWQDRLAEARRRIGAARVGTEQLRAYARTL